MKALKQWGYVNKLQGLGWWSSIKSNVGLFDQKSKENNELLIIVSMRPNWYEQVNQ